MTVNHYSVAAIQMTSGKQPEDNLRQAQALLAEARQKGASLAVLPENFAGYGGDYRALGQRHDDLVGWLCEQARSLEMAIIGGSLPALQRPDGQPVPAPLVRTCSIAVSAAGEPVARYDKLHLFDADVQDAQGRYRESDLFEPGQEAAVTQGRFARRATATKEYAGAEVTRALSHDPAITTGARKSFSRAALMWMRLSPAAGVCSFGHR